jgi:hypothetical protein
VNKKKQKNLFKLGRAGFTATGPEEQKFFAPLFFKKAPPSLCAQIISGGQGRLCPINYAAKTAKEPANSANDTERSC